MGKNNTLFPFEPFSSRRTKLPPTLTQEIITDILIRLPIKPLIRFSLVSKSWFNLIQSPTFISRHLLYHAHKNPLLIVERFSWDHKSRGLDLFLLEIQKKKLHKFRIPKVTDSDMGFKVVGSCNGLICVCLYSLDPSSTLFLWNPASMQIRRIPEHPHALLRYKVPPNCLLGVCYNARVDDYEVVRIHTYNGRGGVDWIPSLNGFHAVHVEKYSLRTGLWKEVKYSNVQRVHTESNDHSVTVNGSLFWVENFLEVKRKMYWVAMEVNEWYNLEYVFSFDVENNVLKKIAIPTSVNPEVYKKLVVYEDSLAILICSDSGTMEQYLDLWVFNDDYNGCDYWIKVQATGSLSKLDHPVGVWKKEVLMASGKVIHSISGIKGLLPVGKLGDRCSYNIFNYKESLVPVYVGNEHKIGKKDKSNKIIEDSLHDMLQCKMRLKTKN